MNTEIPVVFSCGADRLTGILHSGSAGAKTAIVISVGGPQYRVGSHRQFVLMARHFASTGIPVLRFDYRGMGDAEGTQRSFESVDQDIRAAIDCVFAELASVNRVVLLGLCDAASANVIYAPGDKRIAGLILLNPWVRTAQGEAKTYLRHYYLDRLLQKSFWRKVLQGEFSVMTSVRDLLRSLQEARRSSNVNNSEFSESSDHFLARMNDGFDRFRGPVLLLISGNDLTAQEFVDLCRADKSWNRVMQKPATTVRELEQADHTLSATTALDSANRICVDWLKELKLN